MEEKKENAVALKKNVGDQVIERVNELCASGFTVPKGSNYVSIVKSAMMKLQEIRNKDGKSVMECCTPISIQQALFKIVVKGLDISKFQAYPIIRGNSLTIEPSYFGNILQIKRIFPEWEPNPQVIRDGDVFEMAINPRNGRKYLVKHEQSLENMDKTFIGGYIMLPTHDGEGKLYVMTKRSIMNAWSKSSNPSQSVQKTFDEKMVGKTLINSGCTSIINSEPGYSEIPNDDETEHEQMKGGAQFAEYEEVPAIEAVNIDLVDKQTGEIKPEPKKQGRPAKEVADKSKEEIKAEAPVTKEEDEQPF